MTLRIQDVVENVRENLSLGAPDAAVYVQLCVGGPAKASELADALRVHRNEVYRSAERLAARGLIQTTFEKPARYVAVDPDRVFGHEIDERLRAVEALRESRRKVMDVLVQVHAQADAPVKNTYKVIQGRNEISLARNRLLEEAAHSVLWLSTFRPDHALVETSGGLDLLAERAAKGVEVKALLRSGIESRTRLEPLLRHANAAFRPFDAESVIRFYVVDAKELIMYVVHGSAESRYAPDEVAIQTTASGFVQAQSAFFEQCWRGAETEQMVRDD